MKQTNRTLLVATAAATLLLTGAVVARASDAKGGEVHCAGINSCKGTSECKTAKNECKGQNSCKGEGWVSAASAKECKEKGGTVAK